MTLGVLLRSLVWTDHDQSRCVYEESEDSRTRTLADTWRIIFQSLATVRNDQNALSREKVDQSKKQSKQRAFKFPAFYAHCREYAKLNNDDDGYEMFHGLSGSLFVAQPTPNIWIAPVPRDCFRPLAREIHRGCLHLHYLSIPVDGFQEFVEFLCFVRFGRLNVPIEKMVGFDHAAELHL